MEVEILAISAIAIAISIYIYYVRRSRRPKKPKETFFKKNNPVPNVKPVPRTKVLTEEKAPSFFKNWKPRRVGNKLKIPGLLTFKRVIAGFLFLVHGIFFLMLLRYPAPMSDYYAFAIFLTCFILLDYLFRTRRGE